MSDIHLEYYSCLTINKYYEYLSILESVKLQLESYVALHLPGRQDICVFQEAKTFATRTIVNLLQQLPDQELPDQRGSPDVAVVFVKNLSN